MPGMAGHSNHEPIEYQTSTQSAPRRLWRAAGEHMVQQPNNQIYRSVVVLWLTMSVASVMLAAVTWLQLSRRLQAAQESTAIREDLDQILRSMVDAETSQRGYL